MQITDLLAQMGGIQRIGGSQAHADAVQTHRILFCHLQQRAQRRAAAEKILAVNLDPAQGRAMFKHFSIMRRPQADACNIG